jgi:hypothetical protein
MLTDSSFTFIDGHLLAYLGTLSLPRLHVGLGCEFRKYTQHHVCQFQKVYKGHDLTVPNSITKSQVEHRDILPYFLPSLHSILYRSIL